MFYGLRKFAFCLSIPFLVSCGGGGVKNKQDDSTALESSEKEYDLKDYFVASKRFETGKNVEFYRIQYFLRGGVEAAFTEAGDYIERTAENAGEGFKAIKVMERLEVGGGIEKKTKYLKGDNSKYGVNGPFLKGDHGPVDIKIKETMLVKHHTDTSFKSYSATSVLDNLDWEIPRYLDGGEVIVLNEKNSSLVGSYQKCNFEFFDKFNIGVVSPMVKGLYDDVLILSCYVYSVNDDEELGLNVQYYAKDVGLIFRVTTRGSSSVNHIVTDRKLYDL